MLLWNRVIGSKTLAPLSPMVLVFNTTLPGADLIAQVPLIGVHDVTIDWGDGTTETKTGAASATYTRTYATTGTYTVNITGTAGGFGSTALSAANRANFWKCTSFGNLGMTSLQGAFKNAANFIEAPTSLPSTVTNMNRVFDIATSFNGDISGWNTSNVTLMGAMFTNATSFNGNISSWNTGNVTNMDGVFQNTTSFNGAIGGWNTGNVTTMNNMFSGATAFNRDIGGWNTGNVTNMSNMFNGATSFNQDIGGWNTGNVTTMADMFRLSNFNNDGSSSINNWNTANVTTMLRMFQLNDVFNGNIGSWDTSKVTNMAQMFIGATAFNQPIGTWNTSNVTLMTSMFDGATSFNQNIGNWDVSNVTGMNNMFNGATSFNQNISTWCVGNFISEPTSFSATSPLTAPNKPVWGTCPTYMVASPITYIGQATGTTSATIPTHQIGDLILAFAFNETSTTTPTAPAGWTQIGIQTGTLCAARVNYIVATTTSTPSGTWTNASTTIFVVYRGVDITGITTLDVSQAAAVATVTYPANGYWQGLSRLVAFSGHRGINTALGTPPGDLSLIVNPVDGTDEAAAFQSTIDTYGNWPSTGVAVGGTASGWVTFVLRLRAPIVEKTPMTLVYNTTLPGADLIARVPLIGAHSVNIDWGDGTVETKTGAASSTYTRTYVTTGTYTVTIAGTSVGFGSTTMSAADRSNLWKCTDFGDYAMTNLEGAFYNAVNLIEAPPTLPSTVTSMASMFQGAVAFNGDISSWDTSIVTTMASMFTGSTNFNCGQSAGVVHTLMQRTATTGWKTDQIDAAGMNSMFQNASAFAGNISDWCVSSLVSVPSDFATGANANFAVALQPTWGQCPYPDPAMLLVFNTGLSGADLIARVPLNGVHNVTIDWGDGTVETKTGATDTIYTRTYATTGIYTVKITGTAGGFGTFSLTAANRSNLWKCTSFGNLGMTSMNAAFVNSVNLIEVPTSLPSTITNLSSMFYLAAAFNQNISSWNTSNVTNMSNMFSGSTSFNQPVGGWNTSNVTDMTSVFNAATAFNQDIGGWNTSNVTIMFQMFTGATAFNCGQPSGTVHTLMQRTSTTGWRTQGITSINMSQMFQNASSFAGNISNWCVSGIASAPTNFATGANANFTVARQPTWNACPFPD